MAKCPKCDGEITYTTYKGVEARQSFGRNKLNALAHCCPHCQSVLSVEIDPIAVKTDLVNTLLRALQSPRGSSYRS